MPKSRVWPIDRDRSMLLGGSAVITALAWLYLIRMAGRMQASGHIHSHAIMNTGTLFVMWAVMMVAMMLPSTLPFVFAFSGEQARRHATQMPVVPTAFFVAGYFTMWTVFSGACAVLQQVLHTQALLSPIMSETGSAFSGGILIAAGVYQWTPMKNACLRHCRSPLTFLLSEWREGATGAFRMGASHGLFCIGCCWMLMMLPFAAGVMNLVWMAGITVLLMLEKAAPGGELTGRICGALLALLGAYVICLGVVL
jgi:predicted metal-binding membrane protein